MSAYAFGLFPPVETTSPPCEGDSLSREIPKGPLEQERQDLSGTRCEEDGGFSRLFRASVDKIYPLTKNNNKQEGSSSDSPSQCDRAIAVKEAKIDPIRLIQYVTSSNSSQSQQQSRRQTLKRRSLGDVPHSPSQSKRGTSHEEAIQFELSISFNGRRYTAMRTLNAIVQLRDDLIRELNNNQNRWMQHTRQFGKTDKTNEKSIDIPEIPPMTDEGNGSSSFVGRGFTMLHNALTSYTPAIESWLRNIMSIVPQESESLSNFLWEPLSKEDSMALAHSCSSLRSLGSIPELSGRVEHDTDDEWEG
jgi:hypothetical protein